MTDQNPYEFIEVERDRTWVHDRSSRGGWGIHCVAAIHAIAAVVAIALTYTRDLDEIVGILSALGLVTAAVGLCLRHRWARMLVMIVHGVIALALLFVVVTCMMFLSFVSLERDVALRWIVFIGLCASLVFGCMSTWIAFYLRLKTQPRTMLDEV